ncbi:expressed protein, putative [Trichomonas vaginalis G3]|uniref:Expressed protein, putative n=1 Tax=Trichomonas vaginalis (strain ATCC PRA-98 / G3) TaxID=412133 RepID=A2FWK4_TRIV3|nr:trafficking protein particle complex subunit 2-like protein family [Trichomonas vaginalis G3]EAX90714.1 expressed protein, putative [Trichomonas vaginalis G3]KAI5507473.1 trafficking protein particle complex subunit 2-like protein family [Trichomonas vaginalis G3]|eukprot:XP_001303644.1 expressed protein [Trichomonas vaginalis G3]
MATPSLSIACAAITGPDDSLLFIDKYATEQTELEMDSIVFVSLDYFTSTGKASKKEKFIGQLQIPDQKYSVWGYKTNFGYKIVILTNILPNQNDSIIRNVCDKIRDAMFLQFCNPFYQPFSPITSSSFISKVREITSSVSQSSD